MEHGTVKVRNPAQGNNSVMHILILEAAAHSGVFNWLELYWYALVWKRESLKMKSLGGPGESESGDL